MEPRALAISTGGLPQRRFFSPSGIGRSRPVATMDREIKLAFESCECGLDLGLFAPRIATGPRLQRVCACMCVGEVALTVTSSNE